MTRISPPPTSEPIMEGGDVATIAWLLFFNQLFVGDTGTAWAPTFTDLTISGTPTITGKYYKLSQNLCYFSVTVTPSVNTTAVAGTTYIDNFPLDVLTDGACVAVSGLLGSNPGMAEASTNRIYVPGWSAVTVPLTICGTIEAR